jgi:hypothetical protein
MLSASTKSKPARRVAFAVMFAQVACFGDEFSEWFDGWHHE